MIAIIIQAIIILLMLSNSINATTLQSNEKIRENIKSELSNKEAALVFVIKTTNKDTNEIVLATFWFNGEEIFLTGENNNLLFFPAEVKDSTFEVKAEGYKDWITGLRHKVDNYYEHGLNIELKRMKQIKQD